MNNGELVMFIYKKNRGCVKDASSIMVLLTYF